MAQNMTSIDLNQPEIKRQVADQMINCRVAEENNVMLQAAYNDCASNQHGEIQFWQTPGFLIGGFFVTAGGTAVLICVTHFMGACQ
jgi:hypothetical protein